MTTHMKITLAIIAEIAIAAFSYQFCWIIKWPPTGPIRMFTPGIALLVFTFASAVLWAAVGGFWLATRPKADLVTLNPNGSDEQ